MASRLIIEDPKKRPLTILGLREVWLSTGGCRALLELRVEVRRLLNARGLNLGASAFHIGGVLSGLAGSVVYSHAL